ncbi:MAG: hypothetical protein ACRD1Q_14645 [Vicinamibacterales bacterium]
MIRSVATIALLGLVTAGASAQLVDGKRRTGSPTPGTPQPEPPNLADRVTLMGCVQTAARSQPSGSGQTDPSAPSDSRYQLTNAERQNNVPAGTGGSPLTAKASSRTYRLEAIDAQLSPFVGTKVEISGEIKLASQPASGETRANDPTLVVEFVQKIAATCS